MNFEYKDESMSFNNVKTAVIAEAEAEAKKIIEEAHQESKELLTNFRKESLKVLEDSIHQAEVEEERETVRQLGLERHKGRLRVLAAKNQVIDDLFLKVSERIYSLLKKECSDLLEKWVRSLAPEIGGTMRINPKYSEFITTEFLERIQQNRPPEGHITSVVEDSQVSFGFIIEGETFTIDCTLERKLKEIRQEDTGELARELFKS
jgi:V/A-type H+/Na+-transporting ATPase subunit E